jgi:3-methyladenine DNA glycosylase AlkD
MNPKEITQIIEKEINENWSLRQIGKRNLSLNKLAIETAEKIKRRNTKAARWIAADAWRELTNEKTIERLRKKATAILPND